MTTRRLIFFQLMLFVILLVSSCTKEAAPTNVTPELLKSGTWKISLFIENGKNQTDYFTSHKFNFTDTSIISQRSSGKEFNGSYLLTEKDGKNKMSIIYPEIIPEGFLLGDWDIIKCSDHEIQLGFHPSYNSYHYQCTFKKI